MNGSLPSLHVKGANLEGLYRADKNEVRDG